MKSNSNLMITDYKVDPTSQQISEVYINGEKLETASPVTVEDNKTATINVSTYTRPVEITPTSGNDAMAKATVTLSNIPSGSAPDYLTQVTLYGGGPSGLQAFIEDTDAMEEDDYIGTFSGILYVKSDYSLIKTDYTVHVDACGHTVVTIGGGSYSVIKLGW